MERAHRPLGRTEKGNSRGPKEKKYTYPFPTLTHLQKKRQWGIRRKLIFDTWFLGRRRRKKLNEGVKHRLCSRSSATISVDAEVLIKRG